MNHKEQAILNERLRVARSHKKTASPEEKIALVERLRLARERKALATGQVCGQTAPYGTFPGEKQVMDYILSLWNVEPRPSYRMLERQLAVAEIRNRSGGYWSAPQLHGLLKRYFSRQSAQESRTVYSDEAKT